MNAEAAVTLKHDACLYASDQAFVHMLAPFARDGVELGQPVVAAVPSANAALLRDALGHHAGDVHFIDSAQWYEHPVRTIDGYRQTLERHVAAGAPLVRVIGEVQFGSTAAEHRSWTKYEAALNRVFAGSPAWIVCPYDTRSLPPTVVEDARRTHPQVVVGGERRVSDLYLEPEAVIGAQSGTDHVAANGSRLAVVDIDAELSGVRRAVRDAARSAGLDQDRIERVVVAVNEAATNALVHGRPPARVTAWFDGQAFICEVIDRGRGISDPLAGYTPPAGEPESGYGLWIMRQTCDDVELSLTPDGFLVRLAITAVQ